MKSVLFLLLTINRCHAENFILEKVQRAFKVSFAEKIPKEYNQSKKCSHGLEVISAGLARTGSASLQKALNILGYQAYHNSEVMAYDHSELWDRVVRTGGKEGIEDIASVMVGAGYDATTDSPCADFSIQLLDLYPNAKVILSTRPEDRWISSVIQLSGTMDSLAFPPWSFIPSFERFTKYVDNLLRTQWQGCTIGGECNFDIHDHEIKNQILGYFRSHNEMIRNNVSPNQLLEFHPSQGWEPLCNFLGRPIPDEPFPHINANTSIIIASFVLWGVVFLYHACCGALTLYISWKFVSTFTLRLKTVNVSSAQKI